MTTMVRGIIGIAVTVWLAAGCSAAPSLMLSEAQQCTRGGAWWRANLGICEIQGVGKQ
jgi:hypothetical protein